MTRDDLINCLQARLMHLDTRDDVRAQAETFVPLVREVVAEWLENYDGPAHSAHPDIVAREWREEMGGDHA